MLSPGDIVDRFEVEALLGEGGLARVYLVRHRSLGQRLALKVLSVRGSAIGRRLLREGRIQASLSHPHIVAVSDVLEHEGHAALVMEYVEGITLADHLMQHGALPEAEALALFGQVLSGVVAAHDIGVLHRDLKPANILLASTPRGLLAKVTDFGIARYGSGEAGDTVQGDLIGTPGYMAPEQVSDPTDVDGRADLYSLGALLYCMVAGRPPFLPARRMSDTLAAAQRGDFPPLSEVAPSLSPGVAEAITRCLSPRREERPADGRALAALLYGEEPAVSVVLGLQPASLSFVRVDDTPRPTLAPAATSVPNPATPAPAPAPALAEEPPSLAPPTPAPRQIVGAFTLLGGMAPFFVLFVLFVLIGLAVGAGLVWRGSSAPPEGAGAAAPPPEPTAAAPGAPAPTSSPPVGPPSTSPSPTDAATPAAASATPPAAPSATTVSTPTTAAPPPSATAPAAAASSSPSSPAPEAPAPAEAAPEPEAVAVAMVEPPAAASAGGAPVAPPPEAPPATAPAVGGRYAGKWQGRPVAIVLTDRGAGKVSGTVELNQGVGLRIITLEGSVSPDGQLRLTEREEGWVLSGQLRDGQLSGMMSTADMKKPAPLSARRG